MLEVLFIDDDAEVTKVISKLLTSYNMQVTIVPSLKEASQIVKNTQFDVILLDLNLPDSKGINTLKNLIVKAPIVVLTGLDAEIAPEAIDAGADSLINKPEFSGRDLVRNMIQASLRFKAKKKGFERFAKIQQLSDDAQEILGQLLFLTRKETIYDGNGTQHPETPK